MTRPARTLATTISPAANERLPGRGALELCLLVACLIGAALATSPALARSYHSQSMDGLIARCSTVNTATLPDASLERYGVEGEPDRGLLSCVVQKQDDQLEPRNVQARVDAEYHGPGQVPQSIDLREVREQNMVTYLGTFAIGASEVLEFTIELAVDDESVQMSFADTFPQQ